MKEVTKKVTKGSAKEVTKEVTKDVTKEVMEEEREEGSEGMVKMADIHPLDVHPFLDFCLSAVATTLLKRGRDEKAMSALSSRPRFNSVVGRAVEEKSEKGWTSRGWISAPIQVRGGISAPEPL